jgi:hypothetical protein
MTLPDERYRAVVWASRFLHDLAHNTKDYPRVPKKVRREAYSILRHYPDSWDMKRAADQAPDVFQERMDPLHRLIVQHELENTNENRTQPE